ncbi:LacI family DNA-binding transcriptional regulator [Trinickia caryophylli]|uniref:LacI family DNA-binding transcriptional regulator n=1 Tax=Trinickia caryophylli TaxID=28094 RepID=UPI001E5926C1|nr:LacI family DNA-binding transcriptional regulator [Trinickia caryophylli]WQE15114.1 LacI family DNA-binding transcriptional regulator [Trinickia caryophylli]
MSSTPSDSPPGATGSGTRRARRGTGRVTLSDLAARIGVTKVTVSRALNTPELVSAETLERVREAVRETGYTPDLVAGSLASNRSRLVVALIPAMAGGVFQETVAALTNELAASGYQLLFGQSGYDESREDALLDAIIGRRPAGIVLTGVVHSEYARKKLKASGIPVVETWELTRSPLDMLVGFSHPDVGAAAARYLHERGARRPAVVTPGDRRAQVRAEAFVASFAASFGGAHEVPVVSAPSPATIGDGRQALAHLLEVHPQVDAVFCGADVVAMGVLIEARHRGLAVPGRLKVLGYGDQNFAKDADPALSTIRIDGTRIGKLAASMLLQRLETGTVKRRKVDVGFDLISRESA